MTVPYVFGPLTGTPPIKVLASHLDADFAYVLSAGIANTLPSVANFGVIGDGITNDTVAFTTALNSFGVLGGTLRIPATFKMLIGSVTIPANVRVLGDLSMPDADTLNTSVNFEALGSALYTLPGTTITLRAGSSVERCLLSPSTIRGAQQANTSLFAGTCFTNTSGGYGCAVIGCAILGYAKAVVLDQVSRFRFEWNAVDANAVLDITGSFDTSRILNNQCWPYLTIIAYVASGQLTQSLVERSGTAFDFKTGGADTWVDGNLVSGFLVGFSNNNVASINYGNNWVDHPASQNRSGNMGVYFTSGVNGTLAGTFYIYGVKEGLVIDIGNAAYLHIENVSTEQIDLNGIRHESGQVHIGFHEAVTVGAAAIQLNTAAYNFQLDAYQYFAVTSNPPINCGVAGIQPHILRVGPGTSDDAVGSKLIGGTNSLGLTSIASASSIALPATGEMFAISGTTGITAITGGWAGREITLYFLGVLTVTHNSSTLILAGGIDYPTFAATTLTLRANGDDSWAEVGRSKRNGTPVYANQANTFVGDQVITGNAFISGVVQTGAPSGSTNGVWKLGAIKAGVVTLDTTRSIQVDIGGVVYNVMVST